MVLTIYENMSGHNVLNKKLVKLKEITTVEYIHPVDLMNPTFILKPDSKVVEGQIIYSDAHAAYYEVVSTTAEHNRVIANCHRDVLKTYHDEILALEHVILDRVSMSDVNNPSKQLANFFLTDPEIDVLSYPYIETHPLTPIEGTPFSNEKNEFILGITGGVTAS